MRYILSIFLIFSFGLIKAEAEKEWVPRVFKCENLMVEFTLGYYSNPSESELNKLCSCLDKNISNKAKKINFDMKSTEKKLNENDLGIWHSEFGNAMKSCGAMNM